MKKGWKRFRLSPRIEKVMGLVIAVSPPKDTEGGVFTGHTAGPDSRFPLTEPAGLVYMPGIYQQGYKGKRDG